jgi:CubicO group peptidase (beta-lactamase class C family)
MMMISSLPFCSKPFKPLNWGNSHLLFTLFTLLSLALVARGTAEAAQTGNQDEVAQRLDTVTPSLMRRNRVPGTAVALVQDGEIVWAEGYGLKNKKSDAPVTSETVFLIASPAKPVTAWGIMKLVEEGVLDLDVPVEQYLTRWHLPPSEFDHDQVTLRRMLSHTAGLTPDGYPGYNLDQELPTLEESLSGAPGTTGDARVVEEAGMGYHYSPKGYAMMQLVIEEVTGESFPDYMQREILEPLGMVNSRFGWASELGSDVAAGHNWGNRPLPPVQFTVSAAGGLYATAPDMARFIAATAPGPNGEPVGRGVLKPETVEQMLSLVPVAEPGGMVRYGLGYRIVEGDPLVAWHGGELVGWKTMFFMLPERGEGIVILTNGDRGVWGMTFGVSCRWSELLPGHPLQAVCQGVNGPRNILSIVAAVLGLGLIVYVGWVVVGLRAGRRSLGWTFSWGKILRIVLLTVIVVLWWGFWFTDTFLVSQGYAKNMETITYLVPWPTTFEWIALIVILWGLALIATSFVPKVKGQSRQPQATAGEALTPAK